MTKTRTKAGVTGEALLGSMQAVERALTRPSAPSPDQLVARIQEWQQGVTEIVRQQELGVELATLYEIVGLVSSSLDLAETLDLVMDALIHLTGAERGCLMLLNDEGNPQVRAAQSFDQERLDAYELELSRTVVRETVDTGQPVLTTNAQRDPRFSDQESVIGYHLRSIVCVPLCAREEVIGALYLDNRIRDGVFSEIDLRTLTAFASQATVAIQNARLYTTTDQTLTTRMEELTRLVDQERSHAAELATLNSLSQALTAQLDVEQVLEEAYRGVSRLLDATSFYIALYDPDKDDVTFSIDVAEGKVHKSSVTRQAGKGLTEHILRTQKPVLIREDVPTWLEEMGIEPIGRTAHSWLGVPLTIGDQTLGVMAVQSYTAATSYDEHDQDLLMAVASQAAIAIHNARLYEQARTEIVERRRAQERAHRRADMLSVLHETALDLVAQRDLPDLLRAITVRVVSLLEARGAGIYLYRPATDDLELTISADPKSDYVGDVLQRGQGLSGKVLETGRTMVVDNYGAWEGRTAQHDDGDFTACAALPIRWGDRLLGVLSIVHDPGYLLSPDDITLLERLTPLAAAAINQARLLEDLRTQWHEAETLRQVTSTLNASLDREQNLPVILEQLARVVDYDSSSVMLISDNTLEMVAQRGPVPEGQPPTHLQIADLLHMREVIQNRTPVIVSDTSTDPLWSNWPESEYVRCWLGVPLVAQDQVIGVLNLNKGQPGVYNQRDAKLAAAFADQAAVAIENSRLYERAQQELAERRRAEQVLKQRNDELTTLYEAATVISSALSLDAVLLTVAKQMIRAVESTGCALSLWSQAQNSVETLVDYSLARPDETDPPGTTYDLSDYPTTHQVLKTGQPVVVQHNDPMADETELALMREQGVHTLLMLPLVARDQVFGLVELLNEVETKSYTAGQIRLAQSLAVQAAIAIENARLYEEAQSEIGERRRAEREAERRAAQATLIYEVGQRVSSELELETLLSEIVGAVRDAFDYYSVMLMLLDDDREHLVLQSVAGHYADMFPDDLWVAVGEGMTGQAAATGETQFSGDVSQHPHYVRKSEETTRSELGVAIKSGQQILGVLDLQSDEPDAFDATDVMLMETLADQVAVALDNANLYQTVQQELAERKRAEQALQASFDTLNTVLDSIDADVYVADFDSYEILFMNRHMQDSFGHDLAGRKCHEVLRNETRPCSHCTNDQLLDANGNPTGVCVWEGQNPKTGNWYINYDRAVRWVDGHFVRLQIATDITKVKQAEETLRRQRGYLDALHETTLGLISRLELDELLETLVARAAALAGAPNGFVYLYDPDSGDLEMRVGLGDNAYDVGVRLRPGEGVSGRVWQTGQPLTVDDYSTWAGRSMDTRLAGAYAVVGIPLKSGPRVVGVIGLSHSDRSRLFGDEEIAVLSRFAELASIALDNAQLYASLQQELAERQRAEERLQHYAAELEQSNEEVKRFAYIVSHDLRAPLVNLKGFAAELRLALGEIESVVSAIDGHLDEEQRQTLTYALQEDAPEALEFIDTSVTHMDYFITALLKLSRLGRRELKLEPVDVNAIVQTCLQTLAHQIAESQTEVSVGQLPQIVADQTSIEQIMGNILSNAVKYLRPDRPGKVEITAVRGEDETLFQIQDNGRGIAPGNMDKVFAPFRRAGNEDVPGEGMGLAYVQALVRRHAGRIWCESEPGEGTLISFTIPHHLGGDAYV